MSRYKRYTRSLRALIAIALTVYGIILNHIAEGCLHMARILTRKDIEAAKSFSRRVETVSVPEWGGDVIIRTMSGTERDAYEAEIVGNKTGKDRRLNLQNIRAKLIARCLVDEEGAPLYKWHDPSDIGALGDMDARGLDTVFKACQRLNGLTDDDVDELMGNSRAEANGVSGLH